MRFDVAGAAAAPFNLAALQAAWPAAYGTSQSAPVVPETAYGAPTDNYVRISDNTLTRLPQWVASAPTTVDLQPKSDPGTIRTRLWTNERDPRRRVAAHQFHQPDDDSLGYRDPSTETMVHGQPQLWKITHNGVDTHYIHFHLFNVQVINRIGWDGSVRPPDPNEVGWKETVRMNPLEDIVVAMKPLAPSVPFAVPDSIRLLTRRNIAGRRSFQLTHKPGGRRYRGQPNLQNFGWEYVWHCHLLGHEENDMMRPIKATGTAIPEVTDYLLLMIK